MNQWWNNYTPEFYWPEAYWPLGGSVGDSITLTGHQVAFSYGTPTISTVSIGTSSGGRHGGFRIMPRPKPRKRTLRAIPTIVEIRYGRSRLRQKIVVRSSAVSNQGGRAGALRQNIRTHSAQMVARNGWETRITPAKKQKISLFSHRQKTVSGRMHARDLNAEFEEELSILMTLLK